MTAKRVLITGGAAGIGHAAAESYLASGARVAIIDADPEACAAAKAKWPGALVHTAGVTDEAAMGAAFSAVDASWGGVDTLLACAGIGGPSGTLETLDYQAFKECVAVTIHGSFLACRWAAPHMRAQGSGLIVLMSSSAGLHGYPGRSPYAAAKWGVTGLTKTLAMELGPAGIRVNAIAPGAVHGDRMERVLVKEAAASGRSIDALREVYTKGTSLRTWVDAADIVALMRFLDSPAGARISGQILPVDGHTETLAP
ncbi:MAG: SDR family oxidoreductase [Pseudomonadota bacterium]